MERRGDDESVMYKSKESTKTGRKGMESERRSFVRAHAHFPQLLVNFFCGVQSRSDLYSNQTLQHRQFQRTETIKMELRELFLGYLCFVSGLSTLL